MEEQVYYSNESKLIEQAIESAKCRIYKLKNNAKGGSYNHQKKAENQVELMKTTIAALEFYRDNFN